MFLRISQGEQSGFFLCSLLFSQLHSFPDCLLLITWTLWLLSRVRSYWVSQRTSTFVDLLFFLCLRVHGPVCFKYQSVEMLANCIFIFPVGFKYAISHLLNKSLLDAKLDCQSKKKSPINFWWNAHQSTVRKALCDLC